ncbi:MAG: TIGR03668 family PPOX class F420-dependent oxidoreductase [Chloroflexota bacterium]
MDAADRERALTALESGRRAVLATIRSDGRPRLLPIAYAADWGGAEIVIYTAIDEKPKISLDPRALARVRDIQRRSDVAVLVDFWSEDWSELEWVRLDGRALLIDPAVAGHTNEHRRAIDLLRRRYPQYETQRLEDRPVIRIVVEHVTSWSA